MITDLSVVLREAELFTRGWRRADLSGLCARCDTPFLAGSMVFYDRTAGRIGTCCPGGAG